MGHQLYTALRRLLGFDSSYKLHLDVACCGVPITAALTIGQRARLAGQQAAGGGLSAQRINSRLKDSFACESVWVQGHAKVRCHAMFAVLAISVDALMRFMLFEHELGGLTGL